MRDLKHIGRLIGTGKKCLVAFRTLPGDAHNCLIVPTENLPDSYHDAIINLVESTGGQDAYEFGEVLARTQFPDGSIMLSALHAQRRMVAMPTNQIEMIPRPGTTIVLSELNQIIAEQRGVPVDEISVKQDPNKIAEKAAIKDDPTKTTSVSVNADETTTTATSSETMTPEQQAKEYRSKADKLAKEAAAFRRMAEELVPTKKKTTETA